MERQQYNPDKPEETIEWIYRNALGTPTLVDTPPTSADMKANTMASDGSNLYVKDAGGNMLTLSSSTAPVTKIIAGTNVTISPTSGIGDVTINSAGAKGDKGDKGDTGPAGATGAPGTNGTNGATWYQGAGAPGALHTNNDFYLNTTNDDIYQQQSGAWVLIGNFKGATGASGSGTSGTFVNADLVAGVLTITHSLGLSTPYILEVVVVDNNQKFVIPDNITYTTNTVVIDLSSYGSITGTWGWFYSSNGVNAMVYPGAGVPKSTGLAWDTSYTVGTGANNIVQLDGSSKLPAVDGSQLTGIAAGALTKVISVTLTSESTKTISSSLTAGTKYLMKINVIQNTSAGQMTITFNNDTTHKYSWDITGSSQATTFTDKGNNVGLAGITGDSELAEPTFPVHGFIEFQSWNGNDNNCSGNSKMGWYGHLHGWASGQGSFQFYSNTAAVTRIDVATSAGDMTGVVDLYSYT